MSIEKADWSHVVQGIAGMGYQHPDHCLAQIKQVRNVFPDIEPYTAALPTREVLLLMKGTLLPAPSQGCPPVIFVITLQHPFPNSYPILTVEEPKAPFRIKNHPNVDTSGQTYLGTVSQWNAQQSRMVQCCQELQAAMMSNYPFESGAGAAQPQQAPPPPQPQPVPMQQQQQPVRVQQQQQPVNYQQQRPVQQQQHYRGQTTEADVARALAKGSLSLLSAAVGAGNAMTGSSPQDRQRAQQKQMQADFTLLMEGKLVVAPGTEINCPQGFGPMAFMTSRTSIDGGLLTPGQAPLPGPACMEPTPEENHQRAIAEKEAQASSSKGGLLGGIGKLAGKAKNAVENKVRENSFEGDKKKFAAEFPEDAAADNLIMQYDCSCLSGDAIARTGNMFICERSVYFSGSFESKASREGVAEPGSEQPFKFRIPYNKLVSVMKGEACGKKYLHLFTDDNTFRSFLSFKDTNLSAVGAYVSVSMSKQPDIYDRAWNWLDHTWRKATPVPSPTYVYYGQAGPLGYQQQQQQQQQQQPQQPGQAGGGYGGYGAPTGRY